MAITKFGNSKAAANNQNGRKLKRAIDYVINPDKTRSSLTGGIGVDMDNAFERMTVVKQFYNKSGGREYKSFVVSFKGERFEDLVYTAASSIAEYFSDYQVLYAVHTNTDNTHIHFIINSVSIADGHKMSQSKEDLKTFKEYVEQVTSRLGLDKDYTLYSYDNDELSFDCDDEDFSDTDEYFRRQYLNTCSVSWDDDSMQPVDNSSKYPPDILNKIISGEITEPIIFFEKQTDTFNE